MSPERLNHFDRLNGRAKVLGVARLDGWGVRFDLFSRRNACVLANIVESRGEHVLGVLFFTYYKTLCFRTGSNEQAALDRLGVPVERLISLF
jgi:hypothetical protein